MRDDWWCEVSGGWREWRVEVNGLPYTLCASGEYSEAQLELLAQFVTVGSTVVDAGPRSR